MVQNQKNEQKITAANYILTFYQEVEALISTYAQYANTLIELENKSGKDAQQIEEQDREAIKTASQTARYYTQITHIKITSIAQILKINKKEIEQLTKTKEKLQTKLIVPIKDLEQYVIQINTILLNNIIQTLLQNSNELLNEIYTQTTK